LRLDYLDPLGAACRFLLPALANAGLRVADSHRGGNPCIALEGAWSDYYNARSRSLKKSVNLASNRLHKAGAIRIEWITSGQVEQARFEQALDAAIGISGRSWKRETGNALDQPGPRAFIQALSQAAFRRGWASIWLLFIDERPLAMEYQLIHDGTVHALRADFDADCTDISPGAHLARHLLERLFGRGWHRYYLGPGDNPVQAAVDARGGAAEARHRVQPDVARSCDVVARGEGEAGTESCARSLPARQRVRSAATSGGAVFGGAAGVISLVAGRALRPAGARDACLFADLHDPERLQFDSGDGR
jgi:hypothetical protein